MILILKDRLKEYVWESDVTGEEVGLVDALESGRCNHNFERLTLVVNRLIAWIIFCIAIYFAVPA